jgi:hypothetical protein
MEEQILKNLANQFWIYRRNFPKLEYFLSSSYMYKEMRIVLLIKNMVTIWNSVKFIDKKCLIFICLKC